MSKSLNHPILGKLTFDGDLDWWGTKVKLQDELSIDLHIAVDRPKLTPQDLDRAVEFLDWARKNESDCREWVANGLLDIYNEHWAEEEDRLDRSRFIERIVPQSLVLNNEDGSGVWYYDDGDLFAGHAIALFIEVDKSFSEVSLAG
jgi:hypothetical protein